MLQNKFVEVEKLLVDDEGMGNSSSGQPKMSIAKVRPISLFEHVCYEWNCKYYSYNMIEMI